MNGRPYTRYEKAQLLARYGKDRLEDIIAEVMPDRNPHAVVDKAHRMGLRSALAGQPQRKYSDQFYDDLLAEFAGSTAAAIAERRGLKVNTVEKMLQRARRPRAVALTP